MSQSYPNKNPKYTRKSQDSKDGLWNFGHFFQNVGYLGLSLQCLRSFWLESAIHLSHLIHPYFSKHSGCRSWDTSHLKHNQQKQLTQTQKRKLHCMTISLCFPVFLHDRDLCPSNLETSRFTMTYPGSFDLEIWKNRAITWYIGEKGVSHSLNNTHPTLNGSTLKIGWLENDLFCSSESNFLGTFAVKLRGCTWFLIKYI